MNKRSLEKELKRFKSYLKDISKEGESHSPDERKIISYTLEGMIMTIHNLIKTGAYDQDDNTIKKLFNLVDNARNTAIHYGYFNDLNNIYQQAKEIASNIPDDFGINFATLIPALRIIVSEPYYQLFQTEKTEIKEVLAPDGYFLFRSLRTKEELYIRKEDLIIIENQINHQSSYLVKASSQENMFYKKDSKCESSKVDFNSLLNSGFLKQFKIVEKGNKLNNSLNKVLDSFENNTYKNIVICYKYNERQVNVTAHNILKDFVDNKILDDKILNGNFVIRNYDEVHELSPIDLIDLPIKDMTSIATLSDIFFIEFYIKRYNMYQDLKNSIKEKDLEISTYAKQALLINLFETGAASLSDKFLSSDRSKQFAKLFYDYKKTRNELAHCAITNRVEKEMLINNLELYSDAFFNIVNDVYNSYCKEKYRNSYSKLPPLNSLDSSHEMINNKTHKFALLEHLGICKIINGRKYLKLKTDTKHSYLDVEGSLLSLDYNIFSSKQCIASIDHAKIVEIDDNTGKIASSPFKIRNENTIDVDYNIQTLIQAQDYFKTFPQYNNKKDLNKCFSAITYLDKDGNPTYTEGLKNVIYRRFSQKIIPTQLLEASSLVIPQNIDEPMTILNKDKTIVAKVYLACINNIDGQEIVSQLTQNKRQKEIAYGKLLPKDLRTSDIIMTTKEGRR